VNPRTESGANPQPYAYGKKYKILKKSRHFLQSPGGNSLYWRYESKSWHLPPKTVNLESSTPAFDLADDERNPVVKTHYITNDGSKQALRVSFVGPKRLKDDSKIFRGVLMRVD
jgi:hypothetical protein